MALQFTIDFRAYCGMAGLPKTFGDDERADARTRVARRLVNARRDGCPVSTLEKGHQWEIGEPDGAMMVPDFCGVLTLTEAYVYEAPCGGSHSEDREDECPHCNDSHGVLYALYEDEQEDGISDSFTCLGDED